MVAEDVETTVRKYALQNAVFYKGKANPKAVVGKVMGECPELRKNSKELVPIIERIVAEVNGLGADAQEEALRAIDSGLMVKEKKERRNSLPELEASDVPGGVVMRIAPGPSGPLHLGHSRVALLNDEYVKMSGGRLVNRFEDTNPEKVDPEAYHMIAEDLEWLGVDVHETVHQSDRFQRYYDVIRKLTEMGHAYICLCDSNDWREMKVACQACGCRGSGPEDNLERLDRLLSSHYSAGEAAAVVKTAVDHPNPALRDFIALRQVDHPHPRTGDRYNVYPMMNLSVAVDDHDFGITHVMRGKDHLNNTHRQGFIYDYLSWTRPVFIHYGLVSIPDTVLKTSVIGQGIKEGEYKGWDDVRVGTLRALRRRGISPEAIRRYWLEVGIKQVDVQVSWDNLFAINRDIVEPEAKRFFFVPEPVKVSVEFDGTTESSCPLHPDRPEMGVRRHSFQGDFQVHICSEDHEELRRKGMLRLKGLCNIESGETCRHAGDDKSVSRQGVRIVQWAPEGSLPAEVVMPDGGLTRGLVEPLDASPGDVVQFERFGFVRIESVDDGVRAVYAHR